MQHSRERSLIILALLSFAGASLVPPHTLSTDIHDDHSDTFANAEFGSDKDNKASVFSFSLQSCLQNLYIISLVPLFILTIGLGWFTRPQTAAPLPAGFRNYSWKYLSVWAIAISADWLQGPYVYALYASYGFNSREIAQLFVAGFGASMLFGTFVGIIADSWGRKRCAVLYCILYAASCLTKHFNNYSVLMAGRITGGIATSILFSCFECWMVAEHRKNLFSEELLRYMFGLMFLVQYLTAVIAGLCAQLVADAYPLTHVEGYSNLYVGGNTSPFDLSFLLLITAIPAICFLWDENFGGKQTGTTEFLESLAVARHAFSSSRVWMLGIIVASFEGCMYAFIFNWTPALDSVTIPPPHGLIFSSFMMACMCGSCAFSLTNPAIHPAKVLLAVGLCATSALCLVTLCLEQGDLYIPPVFVGFLLFEACVGMYFPAVGVLKSNEVPEEARAGVYNAFRIPLNAVVVALLLTNTSLRWSFAACCIMLTIMLGGIFMYSMQLGNKAKLDMAQECEQVVVK